GRPRPAVSRGRYGERPRPAAHRATRGLLGLLLRRRPQARLVPPSARLPPAASGPGRSRGLTRTRRRFPSAEPTAPCPSRTLAWEVSHWKESTGGKTPPTALGRAVG